MSEERSQEVQLQLFQKQLVWQEFPQDVRQQITQLLAILCIAIVEGHESSKEQDNE